MKALGLTIVLMMAAINFAFASTRIYIPMNSDWKFYRGDVPRAEYVEFNDSDWNCVHLPHTWNNFDGQDGGTYYRGPGWYRKTFTVPPDFSGKRVFIRFGAAGMIADVYLNGKFIGEHKGGFSAFVYDITSGLNFDKSNTIAVKVDNTSPDSSERFQIPPISADFTMDGGLYRKVELIATNEMHISLLDHASPGVFISQKNVTDDYADISIRIELRNDSRVMKDLRVNSIVRDEAGKAVASSVSPVRIDAGYDAVAIQQFKMDRPHLWDGRIDPYLYRVTVSVEENGNTVDEVVQPLGVRYYKVDPDKGFYLNGKPYKLHGFCLHEDKENEGRAITDADRKQEMDYMLDIGATVVRLAHYQHATEIYNLCDKNGIVVWTEIPLVNQIEEIKSFSDNAKQQLIELIRQNFNHPSILFWGIFNEILNSKGPDPTGLVKELNALAKEEDPTRPTTSASNSDTAAVDYITDVIGLNKYFGWYNGSIDALAPFLDEWHKEHPGRAFGLSEYGAGASIYQHEDNPAQPRTDGPWHPEEYQTYVHEISWKAIEERPFVWFSTVWNGFDFSSDFRRGGFKPGVNDKGLVTQDHSTRKDSYYWYKVNWNPEPMVHITGKRFTVRDTSAIDVKVYSNAAEVELFVNGSSIGKARSEGHRFIWKNVNLIHGSNDVRAVASFDGREIDDECWWKCRE